MTDRSFPTWIILQPHGMVPDKKGPFYETKRIEEFLRDLYSLYPGCICIVVNDLGAAGWHPQHGYEWLDEFGDKRRRHPRKDEQENKPIGYLRGSGLEMLKTGSACLYKRRDWQANIPVYAYPSPELRVETTIEDYRAVLSEARDYIKFIGKDDSSVVISHIDQVLSGNAALDRLNWTENPFDAYQHFAETDIGPYLIEFERGQWRLYWAEKFLGGFVSLRDAKAAGCKDFASRRRTAAEASDAG